MAPFSKYRTIPSVLDICVQCSRLLGGLVLGLRVCVTETTASQTSWPSPRCGQRLPCGHLTAQAS